MNIKQCKESGNWFTPKRNNQRFENNKARSKWHNRKYRKMYAYVNKTNGLLFKNYKILIQLIGLTDYLEIEKIILKKLRYDFSLCTGIIEKNGLKSFSLYDIQLTFITNDKILIERYEDKRFI